MAKTKKREGLRGRTLLCFSGVQKAQAKDISKREVFSAGIFNPLRTTRKLEIGFKI